MIAVCLGLILGLMLTPWEAFRIVESDDPDVHYWASTHRVVAVLWLLGFCGAVASSLRAFLSPSLQAGRITKTPGVCEGSACIRGTRITVWGLEEWRRLGLSNEEIQRRVQGLTEADLEAAWDYAARHPAEIEQAIRRNAAA